MKKNKVLYTINYDKIVDFKERVTRFIVRFEFKRSENENQFLKEVDSLTLANVQLNVKRSFTNLHKLSKKLSEKIVL